MAVMNAAVITLATGPAGEILTGPAGDLLTTDSQPAGFHALPADVARALITYGAMVRDGAITFDPNGYAHDPYPDAWLAGHLASHLPADDMTPAREETLS